MGNTTSIFIDNSLDRFLQTTKCVTHPSLQKTIQDIDPTILELHLAEQEIKYPCARTRWISIMQERSIIDWSDSYSAAVNCTRAMSMNEPTFEYVEALIGHIVARSLKGGVLGASAGIGAMCQLTSGFDAYQETWKLDDQTQPDGKAYLRQLITNAIKFLRLNFELDRFVLHGQYTCDIRFGIYEVLDLIKVGQGEVVVEEEEEEEDEEVWDEADWE